MNLAWEDRIANYVKATGFPRSLFLSEDGRVVGTWIMGNNYKVKSTYYGGYQIISAPSLCAGQQPDAKVR